MNLETIQLATSGNEDALKSVLLYYKSYIKALSWNDGNYNKELEGELVTALLVAVLKFRIQ